MAGNYGNGNREKTDNSGALFKNNRRENDKQPEYTGQVMVNGVEMWISAWIKESKKDGSKFFSLAFQPKDQQGQQRPQGGGNFRPQGGGQQRSGGGQQSRGGGGGGGFDKPVEDEIPFAFLLAAGLASLLMPLHAWLA